MQLQYAHQAVVILIYIGFGMQFVFVIVETFDFNESII